MICKICGKEFEKKYHTRQLYCSEECAKKARYERDWKKKHNGKSICVFCGKEFVKKTPSVYCSPECKRSFLEDTILKATCKVCGKKFTPTPHLKKFCSETCRELALHHKIEIARNLVAKEKSLAEINALARANGLSYGKYVDLKERGLI